MPDSEEPPLSLAEWLMREPPLSLAEWLVLCLVCEQPEHGFAIAQLLGPDGGLGQIWQVPKATVYRALPRLELLGLATTSGEQRSSHGPARSLVEATGAGRDAARAWLGRPVAHARDLRSELLLKLALLDRAGGDPGELLRAQHARLVSIAAALSDRLNAAAGFDRTLIRWRYETISASIQFLDGLLVAWD